MSFADPENPFWIVTRAGDKTALLSRQEERVLSAVPRDYATDAAKIRLAARVPEHEARAVLERAAAQARRSIRWLDGNQGLSDHLRWDEASSIRSIPESCTGAPPACRIPAYSQGALGHF